MAPTCWRTLPCVTVAISVFPLVLVHLVDVCSALQCVMRLRIHVRNGSGLACLNACFLCLWFHVEEMQKCHESMRDFEMTMQSAMCARDDLLVCKCAY